MSDNKTVMVRYSDLAEIFNMDINELTLGVNNVCEHMGFVRDNGAITGIASEVLPRSSNRGLSTEISRVGREVHISSYVNNESVTELFKVVGTADGDIEFCVSEMKVDAGLSTTDWRKFESDVSAAKRYRLESF